MNRVLPRTRSRLWSAFPIATSQAASSLGNLMLLVAVSRQGDARDLGRVAIVSVCYQVALGFTRAMLGEVALVRSTVIGRLDPDAMMRSSWFAGAAAGGVLAIAGLAMGMGPLWILGACLPALVAYDSLRYIAFATTCARRAARADVVWLVSFTTFLCVVTAADLTVSVEVFVAVWSVCGAVAILCIDAGAAWRGLTTRSSWIRESHVLSRVYAVEYVLAMASSVVPTVCVASFGGLTDVGGLRLAYGYLGPIAVLWASTMNFAIPILVRRERDSATVERRLSAAAVGAVVVWVSVALVVPERDAAQLLGDSWRNAREWIPWVGAGFAAAASYCGALIGLRATNRAGVAMRARLRCAPVSVLAPIVGFALGGAAGFGIGLTGAALLLSALLWGAHLRTSPPAPRAVLSTWIEVP